MTLFVLRFLIRTPLAHRRARCGAARLGGAARGDGAVHRQLAAHDDRDRRPKRPTRLARPGRLRGARREQSPRASRQQNGVAAAEPVATAPFAGAQHTRPAGTIRAGAGYVVAVPPGYQAEFHTFRMLYGALQSDGVVLDQQLAATLQAGVGDTVLMTPRAGAKPVPLKVTGVAIVSAGDTLFQPLIPLLGPAPANRPPTSR